MGPLERVKKLPPTPNKPPPPLPPLPAPFNLLVLSGTGHFVLYKTDIYGSPHAALKEKKRKKKLKLRIEIT